MKKIVLLSLLVALFLGSSCSHLTRGEQAAIGVVVVIGAVITAIAVIDHNSDKHSDRHSDRHHNKRHSGHGRSYDHGGHHGHGSHCRCHRCH